MRDLIGHDQKPAAFMVYLHLYGQAARNKWRLINASVRTIADATGLSKSAVHAALTHLRRRQLIATTADHPERYSAPSRSPSLAKVIATIMGRLLRLLGRRCARRTNLFPCAR
jgi:DNA-binding MarR family transcriptional regulator